MLIITVEGGSKTDRDRAKQVVMFLAKQFLPTVRKLTLNISICSRSEKQGSVGQCNPIAAREYNIEVCSGVSLKDFVDTLIHEMCHVKQFVEERLVITDEQYFWEGKNIPERKTDKNYPWEIEARNYEKQYSSLVWEQDLL